mgnify:CR=1 FL=1|tara:strand:+ start:1755 stop:2669 length:915 start_codon:yes stop_codon:yes gene_type:complete
MSWKKLGLILKPKDFNLKWWQSFGMDPTPLKLRNSIYRIFFCGRNKINQSQIGFADIDLNEPTKILKVSKNPVLEPGSLGSFDDNGVTASCAIRIGSKIRLYYIGWKPKSTTRYSLMTGLAISKNQGKSFKRYSRAPILNLTDREPYSILTAPFVLKLKKNRWIMWYVSCEKWVNKDYPIYNIKHAFSKDGITWNQKGLISINLKKKERAVARPCVLYENNIFKMWYCYETKVGKYMIGYAQSKNGTKWIRKDQKAQIFGGKKGEWDSEMIAYPYVIKHKKKKFMFYNGNTYGKDGVALAIKED